MSTTRITASRGADLSRTYTWPDTTDLTGYTGTLKVYDALGGNTLLTVTTSPNGNGSVLTFSANTLALFVAAADIATLAVATPTTDPAVYYYDLFIDSGPVTTKFQGGAFVIPPIGAIPPGAETLDVPLDGQSVEVNVAAQGNKGDPGGNAMAIGLFTAATGLSIPVGTDLVQTSGYSTAGIGKARYVYDATVDAAYVTANPYTSFISANSRGFKLNETTPTLHMFGARGDGVTLVTTQAQAFINYITTNGLRGHWPKDGEWRTDRLDATAPLYLTFDPAAQIKVPSGKLGFLRIRNTACYLDGSGGATITGDAGMVSHLINLAGAQRAIIRGFASINTSGYGEDPIYVGAGSTYTYSKDVLIEYNGISLAGRNNISVVSGDGVVIRYNDITAASGTLVGAGIDVEKNTHSDTIKRVEIYGNHIHGNGGAGVLNQFGDDVQIYGNYFSGNTDEAVIVASGGAATSDGVGRSGVDFRAVEAVDIATGWITISNGNTLEIGTIFSWGTRSGGVRPGGLSGTYFFVVDKTADNTQVRIAAAGTPYTTITSFTSGTTGTLTTDPATSAVYLKTFVEGGSSNVKIYNNKFDGTNGGNAEILISAGAVNVDIYENDFDCTGSDRTAIYAQYARNVREHDNRGKGMKAGTTGQGVHVTSCSRFSYGASVWKDFQANGYFFSSVYRLAKIGRPTIVTCGAVSGKPVSLTGCARAEVLFRVMNDPGYVTTYAVYADSNSTNCVVDGCDVNGAGNSNANCLSFTSTTTAFGRNVLYDGTNAVGRFGSKTWSPGAIASGASVSTTVTVTGAATGDIAIPTFSGSLGGCTLSATISAAGTATAVITNNTGGSQTPTASSTLTVSAMKHLQ